MILVSLAGCHRDHTQSMLLPAGPAAAEIAWLSWLLIAVCGGTFVMVMILVGVAVFKKSESANEPGSSSSSQPLGQPFVVMMGLVFPTLVLVPLLLISVQTSVQTQVDPEHREKAETIRVIGHMWWWEVHYPDHGIEIANEIHLPVGEPVRVELESADVIHSLWIPNLQGKMDLIPGLTNVLWLEADRPGEYRGACAEYCGIQHAKMGLVVVARPRNEFDEWVADRLKLSPELSPAAQRGRDVFYASTCHNYHSIAGSEALASRGPDLTHIGSRKTLGAGLLPNNHENLIDWISRPQALKPGSLMPKTQISPDDMRVLIEYLESLQ